jgi:hypothetical protein
LVIKDNFCACEASKSGGASGKIVFGTCISRFFLLESFSIATRQEYCASGRTAKQEGDSENGNLPMTVKLDRKHLK